MAEVLYEAKERQRVSVVGPVTLSNNQDLASPYHATDGETVEWVVEKGKRLYGSEKVSVKEVEARGERG